MLLEVEPKADALLLVLVGVIEYDLEGSPLNITRPVDTAVEVWVVLLHVLLDLLVEPGQVRWTKILAVVIDIGSVEVAGDIPKLRIVRVDCHANGVAVAIHLVLG